MKITTEQELLPFNVPNFVLTRQPVRPRQEGVNFDAPKYAIHELDDKILDLLCRRFRDDVFAKAKAGRSGDDQQGEKP
jgi:hypothetical protein